MANEHECIVCGKPRFMIEYKPDYFHPLLCSMKCTEDYLRDIPNDVRIRATFEDHFMYDDKRGRMSSWTLGY